MNRSSFLVLRFMNLSSLFPVIFVSAVMFVAAIVMIVSHIRTWQEARKAEHGPEERDYRWRQFRRRMQTSAMLGLLGVAILVGYILTLWLNSPMFTGIYWFAIILVILWTCLLALADIWATKYHFGRIHDRCLIEQAKLRAEIQRMQASRNNEKGMEPARTRKSEAQEDGPA
jgi:UDP-N-acetylmuramyl pentapeptide phosphotransferase/UDP-N-acetylglucosamine-1-phosphate transferase